MTPKEQADLTERTRIMRHVAWQRADLRLDLIEDDARVAIRLRAPMIRRMTMLNGRELRT